jgi:hypothetical protein
MTIIEQPQTNDHNLDEALSSHLVEKFQQDGYIVVENILPQDLVAEMYREYMKALNDKIQRFGLERVKPIDGRDKYNNEVGILSLKEAITISIVGICIFPLLCLFSIRE